MELKYLITSIKKKNKIKKTDYLTNEWISTDKEIFTSIGALNIIISNFAQYYFNIHPSTSIVSKVKKSQNNKN